MEKDFVHLQDTVITVHSDHKRRICPAESPTVSLSRQTCSCVCVERACLFWVSLSCATAFRLHLLSHKAYEAWTDLIPEQSLLKHDFAFNRQHYQAEERH